MGKSIRKFFENQEFHGYVKFFGDVTIETVGSFAVSGNIFSSRILVGDGNSSTPSMSFTNYPNTGFFYFPSGIYLSIGGSSTMILDATGIQSITSTRSKMVTNISPTATAPVFLPNRGDANTGLGWAGAGILSLIADGVSAGQVKATGMLFPLGFQSTAQSCQADDSEEAINVILPMTTNVDVDAVTNDADDFIVLPSVTLVPVGHTITICNNAGSNFELRTPALPANEKINNVDCDGDQELLMTDTEVVVLRMISETDGWTACAYPIGGGVGAAVTPN